MYKSEDAEFVNNYRPISFTSIPCKVVEHIFHYLNEILDNVPHHRQHGLRRGLSCHTQLYATDKGHTTHAIIMNLKNAFDKVPHALLLQTIKNTWNKQPSSKRDTGFFHWQTTIYCPGENGLPMVSKQLRYALRAHFIYFYINDLPDMLSCKVILKCRWYTLLYQTVDCPGDAVVFQKDINAVYE